MNRRKFLSSLGIASAVAVAAALPISAPIAIAAATKEKPVSVTDKNGQPWKIGVTDDGMLYSAKG